MCFIEVTLSKQRRLLAGKFVPIGAARKFFLRHSQLLFHLSNNKKRNKMKRTKSESPEPCNTKASHTQVKRAKHEEEEETYNYNLLDLSDDVLLHIFKYLSAIDLMSLYLSCHRLNILCCDKSLWRRLDLSSQHFPLEELNKYVRFMQPVTKILTLRGNKRKDEYPELDPYFLKTISIKCTQLQNFILEDYSISREKIQITHFPKTLEKLSLKGCQVFRGNLSNDVIKESYLCKIDTHMPKLTSLILTNCNWLNSHSFMAISKIPNLKEVRLNSCYGLSEDIAYASLACKYGLKSLEVLDLRDTFVGDSVVSSFSHTTTLTEIYLECPSSGTVQHQPDDRPPREVLYVSVQFQHGLPVIQHADAIQVLYQNELNNIMYNSGLVNADRCQVTDRSICSLGLHMNEYNRDEVQLVMNGSPRTSTNPKLKKVVVRNYRGVTNQTLHHFLINPNIEYLDVTGTSVTKEGLEMFKIRRPDVKIISSFEKI